MAVRHGTGRLRRPGRRRRPGLQRPDVAPGRLEPPGQAELSPGVQQRSVVLPGRPGVARSVFRSSLGRPPHGRLCGARRTHVDRRRRLQSGALPARCMVQCRWRGVGTEDGERPLGSTRAPLHGRLRRQDLGDGRTNPAPICRRGRNLLQRRVELGRWQKLG